MMVWHAEIEKPSFLKNFTFISNNKKFQCYSNLALTFDSHLLNISNCFIQFLWFFNLKCWFKGQMQGYSLGQIIPKIHFRLA